MKKNIKPLSILITLIVSAILGYVEIGLYREYGWTIFLMIPFLIGFLPPFIVGRQIKTSIVESFKLSFLTLGIVLIGLLVFAIEGMICIAMALPIITALTCLGSYLGFLVNKKKWLNSTNGLIGLLLISIGTMSFDHANEPENLIPVKTKIIVDAPIEKVWENVVTFNKIDKPTDWIFKTGISYPTDAKIKGAGVGAIRYCNFTTGSFVEPITTWEEPNLLQFDVVEQPIPMNEFNPFWDIHPPHLDGYFKSYKGQFRLVKTNENKTELEGTTWYKVDITPEIYWKIWSDFIIHRIHKRVLNHIKIESESKTGSGKNSSHEKKEDQLEKNQVKRVEDSKKHSKFIEDYIPKKYQVVILENEKQIQFKDINGDNIEDFVAIIAETDTVESEYENSKNICIVIYEGTSNGKYIKKAQSEDLTFAFLYSQSNPLIIIDNNIIKVRHSSMRSDYELKFRFENKYKDYMLIGSEYDSYSYGQISSNYVTKVRIKKPYKNAHHSHTLKIKKPTRIKLQNDLIPLSGFGDSNIYDILGNW